AGAQQPGRVAQGGGDVRGGVQHARDDHHVVVGAEALGGGVPLHVEAGEFQGDGRRGVGPQGVLGLPQEGGRQVGEGVGERGCVGEGGQDDPGGGAGAGTDLQDAGTAAGRVDVAAVPGGGVQVGGACGGASSVEAGEPVGGAAGEQHLERVAAAGQDVGERGRAPPQQVLLGFRYGDRGDRDGAGADEVGAVAADRPGAFQDGQQGLAQGGVGPCPVTAVPPRLP